MRTLLGLAELIESVQRGDKDALVHLTEVVRPQLYQHLYRLTADEDLANDIAQESLVVLLEDQHKVPSADRFWPWMYTVAHNRLRFHYTKRKRKRTVPLSALGGEPESANGKEGLARLISEELKQAVLQAMGSLSLRHQTVLTMRCYEGMDYAQIGRSIGCSRFAAKVSFYRAKKALHRQLARRGLGKNLLVLALVLYGKMTSVSKAAAQAIRVPASTLQVGPTATTVAIATGRGAMAVVATAGVLAVGGVVREMGPSQERLASPRGPAPRNAALGERAHEQTTTLERRYFFPTGPGGAVMMRIMECDGQGRPLYCQILQNEHANYEYDSGANCIYINNFRWWDRDGLTVQRLPVDHSRSFARNRGGLLVIEQSHGAEEAGVLSVYHRNALDEKEFQFNWTDDNKTIDRRDLMHKRGWTFFHVRGQLNGRRVTGTGRIPFVYATRIVQGPWLRCRIGSAELTGTGENALIGLSRPWMGLHTIDRVRRDAAEQSLPFDTRYNSETETGQVTVRIGRGAMVYTINMERDLVERVDFTGDVRGSLEFSYLQEIGAAAGRFTEPRPRRQGTVEEVGVLFELLDEVRGTDAR